MEEEFLKELEADGSSKTGDLSEVVALANRQLELETEVATIEAQLKAAKESLRKVQERDLPAALKGAGITSFQLANGKTVSYTEDLKVSVPKKHKAYVLAQMRNWGLEDKITVTFTADLGRCNDNAAKAMMAQAEEMGVKATLEEDVATGSVKAALRKRIEEGKNDDLAQFGAFPYTKATVK